MIEDEQTTGLLWHRMNAQRRLNRTDIDREGIPTAPGIYAWYRNETAVHVGLYLIHISEPTRLLSNAYAAFCLTKDTHMLTPH